MESNLLCDLIREGRELTSSKHYYTPHVIQEFHQKEAVTPTSQSFMTELVVAWCREDIEWVSAAATSFDHVIIYSKCGMSPPTSLLHRHSIHFEDLPNVGVCDNTYLTHILTRWDNLANWTVFYKGYDERKCHAVEMIPRDPRSIEYTEEGTGLKCCDGNDGIVVERLQMRPGFKLPSHTSAHNAANGERYVVYHNGTMGHWAAHTFGTKNALSLFSFVDTFFHFLSSFLSSQALSFPYLERVTDSVTGDISQSPAASSTATRPLCMRPCASSKSTLWRKSTTTLSGRGLHSSKWIALSVTRAREVFGMRRSGSLCWEMSSRM
jgi:hypothetical protein